MPNQMLAKKSNRLTASKISVAIWCSCENTLIEVEVPVPRNQDLADDFGGYFIPRKTTRQLAIKYAKRIAADVRSNRKITSDHCCDGIIE